MSKNENEKIDIDIPDPPRYNEMFYTEKGVEQEKETNKSFAKTRTNIDTNYNVCYI